MEYYFEYVLKGSVKQLERIIEKTSIKDREELTKRIGDLILEILVSIEEFLSSFGSTKDREKIQYGYQQITTLLEEINSHETEEELESSLNMLLELTKSLRDTIDHQSYRIYPTENCPYDEDYKPLYSSALEKILEKSSRNLNIFLPEIGKVATKDGNISYYYQKNLNNMIEIFSSTDHNVYAQGEREFENYENMHVISSALNHSKTRISNSVFDLMFVDILPNKVISSEKNPSLSNEESIIKGTAKYLREGGLFSAVIHPARMYNKICRQLSKFYTDLNVYTFKKDILDPYDYYFITGVKKADEDCQINSDVANELRLLNYEKDFSKLKSFKPEYVFPKNPEEISIFRSGKIEQQDMDRITLNSGLLDEPFNKTEEELEVKTRSPLLPFNLGQVGLVLSSGELDGFIDEGDGYGHVIKGQVVKVREVSTVESEDTIEESEVERNQVQIKVLLPNGKLKTIA